MAEDKDQLVGEQAMDTMSVAPPDPGTEHPAQQQMQGETTAQDRAAETGSGVDDEDPLSAHPT